MAYYLVEHHVCSTQITRAKPPPTCLGAQRSGTAEKAFGRRVARLSIEHGRMQAWWGRGFAWVGEMCGWDEDAGMVGYSIAVRDVIALAVKGAVRKERRGGRGSTRGREE